MAYDKQKITKLSDMFLTGLLNHLPHIVLNGDSNSRYAGNLNISFACVESESLIMAIKELAVSSGSACNSKSLEPSHVLKAIGVEDDLARSSIRIGIGRFTTEEEVKYATNLIVTQVNKLRSNSRLWEIY
jgi:cysteine desulfurase